MDVTLKVLCEQIERILKGKIGTGRLVPTRNEIALHIRQGLGFVIKGDVFNNFKIDGQFYANDEYTFTIEDLALAPYNDVKSVTLPVLPIELPKSRGVVAVSPRGYLSKKITPILRKDLDITLGSSRLKCLKKIVYFIEGNKIIIVALGGALYPKDVDVTIVHTPIGGMDEVLNLSDSMQASLIKYVIGVLKEEVQSPEDVHADGIDVV